MKRLTWLKKVEPYGVAIVLVGLFVLFTILRVTKSLEDKETELNFVTTKMEDYQSKLEGLEAIEEEKKRQEEEERNTPYEIGYQNLYPDLYVDPPTKVTVSPKTVYLTFDDGPSQRTREILDILDVYQIKGTFFVCVQNEKKDTKELMKSIVDRGHSIGVHTFSHQYKKIYETVESYLEDFQQIFQYILEATGVKPSIFRFPGGSMNSFNQHNAEALISEMRRRGFVHYDWNVSSEDAVSNPSVHEVYENSIKGAEGLDRIILLFHDSLDRKTTVGALGDIIKTLQEKGYQFAPITNDVKSIALSYRK